MIDDTDPQAPIDSPEEEPAPIPLEEFRARFEKAFQFRGIDIPEVTDEWLAEQRDAGISPIEAFETLTA
jgi:hypothetical protein